MAAIWILALDCQVSDCRLVDYRCPPCGPRTQDLHPRARRQIPVRRQNPRFHNPHRHSNRHFLRNQNRWDILKINQLEFVSIHFRIKIKSLNIFIYPPLLK